MASVLTLLFRQIALYAVLLTRTNHAFVYMAAKSKLATTDSCYSYSQIEQNRQASCSCVAHAHRPVFSAAEVLLNLSMSLMAAT
jgi:hypothetical protein